MDRIPPMAWLNLKPGESFCGLSEFFEPIWTFMDVARNMGFGEVDIVVYLVSQFDMCRYSSWFFIIDLVSQSICVLRIALVLRMMWVHGLCWYRKRWNNISFPVHACFKVNVNIANYFAMATNVGVAMSMGFANGFNFDDGFAFADGFGFANGCGVAKWFGFVKSLALWNLGFATHHGDCDTRFVVFFCLYWTDNMFLREWNKWQRNNPYWENFTNYFRSYFQRREENKIPQVVPVC